MNQNYFIDPAIQSVINANKKQMEMFQSIPKAHINNMMGIAAHAKRIAENNRSTIKSIVNTFNNSNVDEILKIQNVILKSINSANAVNIQRNLFSEIAIKSFKESYRFDNDVVLQAQQTIRDFYINPTAISTLTEAINSSYPINQNDAYSRYNEFINAFKNDYPHPFKRVIRWTSGIVGRADIENFTVNYINNDDLQIQNSLVFAIVCLISFLSTYYPYFKNNEFK